MNGDLIKAIVRCAFKICIMYFMKCFVAPINISSVFGGVSKNYDCELLEHICEMKLLCDRIKNNPKSCDTQTESSVNETDSCDDESEMSNRNEKYNKIKQSIAEKLKETYGDDVCVDFSNNNNNENKILYSIKIKQVGRNEPNPKDFCESDIYVNTQNKMFYVRTSKGFNMYPLTKKSVVRCERTE